MKRQRGRGRKPGGGHHQPNRSFESTGPDLKVRGPASHIYEKYLQLARDTSTSGDRVMAENYLQHAEHYYRLMRAMQPNAPPPPQFQDRFAAHYEIGEEGEGDDGDLENGEGDGEAGEGDERQPGERQPGEQRQYARDYNRDGRDYRGPREPREPREPRPPREYRERRPYEAGADGAEPRPPREQGEPREARPPGEVRPAGEGEDDDGFRRGRRGRRSRYRADGERGDRPERPERVEGAATDRPERSERPERPERSDRAERPSNEPVEGFGESLPAFLSGD
ncbi:MAG: DUF4167 domain-containing protein [Caulobacterales bacterium]